MCHFLNIWSYWKYKIIKHSFKIIRHAWVIFFIYGGSCYHLDWISPIYILIFIQGTHLGQRTKTWLSLQFKKAPDPKIEGFRVLDMVLFRMEVNPLQSVFPVEATSFYWPATIIPGSIRPDRFIPSSRCQDLLLHLEQLYLEDQSFIRPDHTTWAALAIAEIRWNKKPPFISFFHQL